MTSEADATQPPRAMLWNRRDEDKLSDYPPLPEPAHSQWIDYGDRGVYDEKTGGFTADQMRAYADEHAVKVRAENESLKQRLEAVRDSYAKEAAYLRSYIR